MPTIIVGYIAAVLIGIILGLIGAGGSILTVPVLVYILDIAPVQATGYSLFIVGITSLVGASRYIRQKQVDPRTALSFALPASAAVLLDRWFIVPSLPEVFFTYQDFVITKRLGIMVFFAVLMVLASLSMIRPQRSEPDPAGRARRPLMLALLGFCVGLVTGLVGAGGGFLIIPTLVLVAGLDMKQAVGTSLLIITINSLLGFTGDAAAGGTDWWLLAGLSGFAIAGIIAGARLARFIPGSRLKPAFGWFVLIVGLYILWLELVA